MQVQALKNQEYTLKATIIYLIGFIGKALVIAISLFSVLILLFLLILMGDRLYNLQRGENVVPLFGSYVIVTNSMVPTIKVNDAVIVKRSERDDLAVGDIITFKSSDVRYIGLNITHRIVGSQLLSNGDLVYRTKGDNNRIEDSAVVLEKNIYGKVILKIPKVGYIQGILKSSIGVICLFSFPIILLIFTCLRQKSKEVDTI